MLRHLSDGVAGGAEILAGVGVLSVLQGERRHAGVTADQHVTIRTLNTETRGENSLKNSCFSLPSAIKNNSFPLMNILSSVAHPRVVLHI